MKANVFAAGALAAALLIVGALPGAGSASAAELAPPTTIMLAGDSITEGLDGDYTWRYRLAMEFRRQNVAHLVDLVGPKIDPRGGYGHYLGGRDWDLDHDGTSGTTLNRQVPLIGSEIETYQPDILVSFLGTNDFLEVPRSHPDASADELLVLYQARIERVLEDWKSYIDAVRAARPATKIVLGEVVSPRIPQSIRDDYNARLTQLATTTWFGLGSPIEVAQLAGNIWASSRYLYDNLHPTPTGDTYLAQRFAEAIGAVDSDLFPGAIAIERPNVLWDPVLAPKITVSGQRIVVRYGYTARYSSARAMRVRLGAPGTGKVRLTKFRSVASSTIWTSTRLRPGTYRVRIQANRVSMNSTWSRVYAVKVKKPRNATAR